ncbi:hypothetical protein [Bacillus wiedmannii]
MNDFMRLLVIVVIHCTSKKRSLVVNCTPIVGSVAKFLKLR